MAKPQFHPLKIVAVRRPSVGSTALQFEIPSELADQFAFVPGQYLTLRTTIDGQEVRRSYSICSARSQTNLEVGIKQVEGGTFSHFATGLKVGDLLDVMPPQGRFTAPLGGQHDYLLLAAGSGITPCLSIAKSVLEQESQSNITLVYGNQTTKTVMFLDDINDLKDCYTTRLQVFYALSREASDPQFLSGRLSGAMVAALSDKKLIEPKKFDAAYVCGPQAMIEDLGAQLSALGMAKDQVKTELFATTQQPAHQRQAIPEIDTQGKGVELAVILDGKRNSLHMDPQQQTVLAAAQSAGLDLPFSCAGGMCCTCRCKILEGEAVMDVNYSLQDWEIEAGFTLACQSRPTSDNLVLDFDAS